MPVVKKKTKKTPTELTPKPAVPPGSFSLHLTVDEMLGLIQTLGFSKELFDKMADTMRAEGNEKAMNIYAARSELSYLLYRKLKVVANIGEPNSRDVH